MLADMQEIPSEKEMISTSPESQGIAQETARQGSSVAFASPETERAVIAALMTEPSCISTVGSILGGLSTAGRESKRGS